MRGKGLGQLLDVAVGRITPAYAGKSSSSRCPLYLYIGSPPPMRGKGYYNTFQIVDDGITPAYAGKSLFTPFAKSRRKDHPRLCGEK